MKKERFTCKRDHLTIRGECYRPDGTDLPIVIISHGFMANMGMCRKYAKLLAAQGYAAFIFDFNGGGLFNKSGGRTQDMSVLTEVKDLKAVLAFAKVQPWVDTSRVLLMGCSQGGFVSALTATSIGSSVNALVLFYPALCIPDDARRGQMMFARFDPANIPEIIQCGPMKLGRCYAESVIGMDSIREISSYNGPVLIVHGTADRIVPLRYAEQAAAAYPHGSLKIIEGGEHMFRGRHDKEAIATLTDFLREYFPVG